MADSCIVASCQDGTTSLLHVATRGFLAAYKDNTSTLRGLVLPNSPASLHGIKFNDAFLSCQLGRPAINIYSWSKDAPVFRCAMAESVTCAATSPDGAFCFAGSASGKVYVWDLLTGELLRVLQAHYKSVTSVAVSACGQYLASGGQDALVHVLDIASLVDAAGLSDATVQPRPVATFSGHSLPVTSVLFTSRHSGMPRIVSCSLDHSVRWWDVASHAQLAHALMPSGAACIALGPDEGTLYVGCIDSVVYALDSSVVMKHCSEDKRGYMVSAYTPTGPSAASGAASGAGAGSSSAALASSSSAAAASSVHGLGHRYFRGHSSAINAVAVTADGLHVVTASDDGSIRLWQPETAVCTGTIEPRPGKSPVVAIGLLPYKPAAFSGTSGRTRDAHRAGAGSSSSGASAGASSSHGGGHGLAFIAPLKKHIQPISTDWRGSGTGPTDREAVVPVVTGLGASRFSGGVTQYGNALASLLDPAVTVDDVYRQELRVLDASALALAFAAGGQAAGAGAGAVSGSAAATAEVSAATAAAAHGPSAAAELASLRVRVSQLEDENTRWKTVNNKLAERLKLQQGQAQGAS